MHLQAKRRALRHGVLENERRYADIDVERDSAGHVTDLFLTGPTNIVCKGEITDAALTI